MLEATVPYTPPSLAQLLGSTPVSAASAPVAQALARRALRRAAALAPMGAPLLGLGVTAALVAARPRRGARRAHVAVCTGWETKSWCLEFGPGRGDAATRQRAEEDELVSLLSLDALAAAMGLESGLFGEAAREADVLEVICVGGRRVAVHARKRWERPVHCTGPPNAIFLTYFSNLCTCSLTVPSPCMPQKRGMRRETLWRLCGRGAWHRWSSATA